MSSSLFLILVVCISSIFLLVSQGKRQSIVLILSKSQLLMLLILVFFSVLYFTCLCCNLYYFLLSAGLQFSFLFVASLLNWNLVFFFNVGDYGYKFPSVFCLCCISHVLVCSVFHLSQSILISLVISLTLWLFQSVLCKMYIIKAIKRKKIKESTNSLKALKISQ